MSGLVKGFLALVLLFCCVCPTYGVFFTNLTRTLIVTASPNSGGVLKAGKDTITVTWRLNNTLAEGADAGYKTIKFKLCYAPVSQVDRKWRKTNNNLLKDKTCPFNIAAKPYDAANASSTHTVSWKVTEVTPSATYFVRAYAVNADATQLGFGQSTDPKKTTNLFEIKGISGRTVGIDIAAACFSVFSVGVLVVFHIYEKASRK